MPYMAPIFVIRYTNLALKNQKSLTICFDFTPLQHKFELSEGVMVAAGAMEEGNVSSFLYLFCPQNSKKV